MDAIGRPQEEVARRKGERSKNEVDKQKKMKTEIGDTIFFGFSGRILDRQRWPVFVGLRLAQLPQ